MVESVPLSLLRMFEAAGRAGSFAAAARELNRSPSAVSHAIKALERQLGTRLFERTTRSVRLSPEGDLLFRAVSRGYLEIRAGLEAISTRSPNLLRLHCAPSLAAQWLTPRLVGMLKERPNLDVRLAASTDYVDFPSDAFDADIVYGVPASKGVVVVPLGEETVTPMCAPELAAAIAAPEDLLAHRLIRSDNKRLQWIHWFRANAIAVPGPQGPRFDRSFLAIAAAVDGLGVALESTRLAERELESGALIRPLSGTCRDLTYIGHHLVYSEASRHMAAIRQFEDWLLDQLALARADGAAGTVS